MAHAIQLATDKTKTVKSKFLDVIFGGSRNEENLLFGAIEDGCKHSEDYWKVLKNNGKIRKQSVSVPFSTVFNVFSL